MRKVLLIICAVCMLISGCGDDITFKHLTHDEAREMIASNPDVIILDVRTPQEFERKHIVNAVLLPIEDLREGDFSKLPDKDAKILIYCWTGRRAADSAQILIDNGYKNVYEMGGIVDWVGSVTGTELE